MYNAHTFTSVLTAVEVILWDTALIRNHKSTLFACFKAIPVKRFIHAALTCAFSDPVHLKSEHEKACLTAPDNSTKLSFVLILSKHTRFMYTVSYVQNKSKQPRQTDARLHIRYAQVLKGQY